MACDHCTGPDGELYVPFYGVGPHTCFYKIPGAMIGQSVPLPKEEWPSNYREDPDSPGHGIYWCDQCGEGSPDSEQDELSVIAAKQAGKDAP